MIIVTEMIIIITLTKAMIMLIIIIIIIIIMIKMITKKNCFICLISKNIMIFLVIIKF